MNYTEKVLEEFDREFVKDCGPDVEPIFIDAVGSVGPIRRFLSDKLDQTLAEERARVRGILRDENYKLEEWYSSSERPDTLTHFEANQRNMKTRNEIQDLLASLDNLTANK